MLVSVDDIDYYFRQLHDQTDAYQLYLGGENVGQTANQKIDVRYYDISRRRLSDQKWIKWTSGEPCNDYRYLVDVVSASDVWVLDVSP